MAEVTKSSLGGGGARNTYCFPHMVNCMWCSGPLIQKSVAPLLVSEKTGAFWVGRAVKEAFRVTIPQVRCSQAEVEGRVPSRKHMALL